MWWKIAIYTYIALVLYCVLKAGSRESWKDLFAGYGSTIKEGVQEVILDIHNPFFRVFAKALAYLFFVIFSICYVLYLPMDEVFYYTRKKIFGLPIYRIKSCISRFVNKREIKRSYQKKERLINKCSKGINLSQTKEVYVRKDFPYPPDAHEIIYMASHYDLAIYYYVKFNQDLIEFILRNHKGLYFTYFPFTVNKALNPDYFLYYAPYLTAKTEKDLSKNYDSTTLLRYVKYSDVKINRGFLRFIREETDNYVFCYLDLSPLITASDFIGIFNKYCNSIDPPNPSTGNQLPLDEELLIHEKRLLGAGEMIVKQVFHIEQRFSRLFILLSSPCFVDFIDYNEKRIYMSNKQCVVYMLFINHPEGIMFKDLYKYKSELVDLCKRISKRDISPQDESDINDIIDPDSNSINTICSQISSGFISLFDERVAKNYYITGDAATPKKITLDRKLVTFK
jgi:hypothetical protein